MADKEKDGVEVAAARASYEANNQIINVEHFSEAQKRCVERYLELSGASGTLVGAHAGASKTYDAQWDLRPLLLHNASLHVLRFSDPRLAFDRARMEWLEKIIQKHQLLSVSGVFASGSKAGQLWTLRHYHREIASAATIPSTAGAQREFLEKLVTQLGILHRNGIVHGHLTLDNIFISDTTLKILDPGFYVVAPPEKQVPSNALELRTEFPPRATVDIFSLGMLITNSLQAALASGLQSIAARMTSQNSAERPSIQELETELRRVATQSTAPAAQQTQPSPHTRSGKFIVNTASTTAEQSAKKPARELKRTEVVSPELLAKARKELSGTPTPPATTPPPIASLVPPPDAISVAPSEPAPVQKTPPEKSTTTEKVEALKKTLNHPSIQSLLPSAKRSKWISAIIVLVCAVVVVHMLHIDALFHGRKYDLPFDDYWKSGQQALMQQVAQAAIDGGEPQATQTIVADALQGANRAPLAHSGMLRFIFQPRWEKSLSAQDRNAALRLALAPLYPQGSQALPPLDQINPLVIVGVIADLPLDVQLGPIAQFSLASFASLPAPLNDSFAKLAATGTTSIGDPEARALAHLMLGDSSDGVFDRLLGSGDTKSRLTAIQPLFLASPKLADAIATYLDQHGSGSLADEYHWFSAEDVAQWSETAAATKLGLESGLPVPGGLPLEQYADLLKFPEPTVRQQSATAITKGFLPAESASTVQFMASDQNQLSRFQTVALIASLKLDPDSFYSFLQRWFQSKPETSSILGLLLARSNLKGVDPLNIEAVRYLNNVEWQASLGDLAKLTRHPEPLARALAYAKLNPAAPNERSILEKAFTQETNPHFREELESKLKGQ